MAGQHVLADVHAEADLVGPDVVLQLQGEGQEAGVVAPDDLVLQEALLEGVAALEGLGRLLQHLQQGRIDIGLRQLRVHGLAVFV